MRLRATFLWSMIVSLSLTALLGIAALVLPQFGPHEEILGSTGVFAAFSLVALLCAAVLERQRLVPLMWAGIVCSVAATLVWLVMIWFVDVMAEPERENVARTGGTFTVAATGTALVGLLGLPRFDWRPPIVVRRTTVGVSVALAVHVVCMLWWYDWIERYIDDEVLARGTGVLAILVACGALVTPILWKVQAMRRAASSETGRLKVGIAVECPRCHTKQSLMTGPARCAECGLGITIEVEGPRCACGHLLDRLEADRCPACGREIPEADRWAVSADPSSPPT